MSSVVSVIIPCYNHAKYLSLALDSVLGQTFTNWECVVVNDGSSDHTEEVCKDYQKKDNRIKYLYQQNKGLAGARNTGIKQAVGEYILTLDSDDYIAPSFLEKTITVLRSDTSIGAASTFINHFGAYEATGRPKGGGLSNFLVRNNAVSTALFRKCIWTEVGGYDERLRGLEDWEFWIAVTKRGYNIHIIEEALFYYRMHEDSSLSFWSKQNKPDLLKIIIEKHSDIYDQHYSLFIAEQENEVLNLREEIRSQQQKIASIYDSRSYKIGNRIIRFFRIFGDSKS